jgi:hypothetical protein
MLARQQQLSVVAKTCIVDNEWFTKKHPHIAVTSGWCITHLTVPLLRTTYFLTSAADATNGFVRSSSQAAQVNSAGRVFRYLRQPLFTGSAALAYAKNTLGSEHSGIETDSLSQQQHWIQQLDGLPPVSEGFVRNPFNSVNLVPHMEHTIY